MADIKIRDLGVGFTPKSSHEEKGVRHSSFFITLNTNYKPEDMRDADSAGQSLRKAMKKMFAREGLEKIVTFMEGSWDDIISVDGEFVVELGDHPKGNRIHSHATLHFTHRAKIRLDFPAMRQFVRDRYCARGDCRLYKTSPHLDVQMISSKGNIEAYLRKGLQAVARGDATRDEIHS